MPSLDDLKKRIKSVKSTQKITKAMKMVAASKLKKAQSLYQDIQFLTQKMQTLENEVVQKLQADQGPNVQKVVNDLIVAKKITLLFNSQALLAYDRTNPLINITPEVIELLNQANSKD